MTEIAYPADGDDSVVRIVPVLDAPVLAMTNDLPEPSASLRVEGFSIGEHPDEVSSLTASVCYLEALMNVGVHQRLKLRSGQIRPGMSGAPVINESSGHICGLVEGTRDRRTDLGGFAHPVLGDP